jgi:Zn-finger nucleic acid-binding protein
MICPKCDGVEMETVEVHSVKVDRCPVCEGTWYEQHELNVLKDQESNGDFRWLDGGLWQDAKKVAVDEKPRYTCPTDGAGLATVRYGEYDKLIERLADKVDGATFAEYLVDVEQEFVDLFTGEHKLKDEMADLGKVFYLLKLRFAAEHPVLIKIKEAIRNAFPGG